MEGVEASEAGGGGGWKTVGRNLSSSASSSAAEFLPSPASVTSFPLPPPSELAYVSPR